MPCSLARLPLGRRYLVWSFAILAIASAALSPIAQPRAAWAAEAENAAAAAETRLFEAVRYLASDELEGRGVDTQGINLAADYLAGQFAALGLSTELYDGTPFQTFAMVTGAKLGETNKVWLVGPPAEDGQPQRLPLELGRDFNPLAIGGSGKFDLPLVFVGYGITAKDDDYDDYAEIDVENKAVLILRHEPQQANPHSAFNGTRPSAHAPFTRKLSNAYEHGAAIAVFCTDLFEIEKKVAERRKRWQGALDELAAATDSLKQQEKLSLEQLHELRAEVDKLTEQVLTQSSNMAEEFDPVLGFLGAGDGGESQLPALHCRRLVIDNVLRQAGLSDLAALEKAIDDGPKPQSFEIPGWRLQGEVSVNRTRSDVKNVVAVLDGSGPLAEETIVIGAHYDHLGWGGPGSFVPNARQVHNGADDNASGAAALVEVARKLVTRGKPLPRRVVFIAFTGEERGLIGSARYCREPLVPLDKTVAMLNMDMVGRLTDDKLIVQGYDTARQFEALLDASNEKFGFQLTKNKGGFGPSDHSSFYAKKVPVLHFFTGLHKDYHRPSDTADKVNVEGMRRVAEMVADLAVAIATAEDRPEYRESARPAAIGGGGDRPYFGSIPDFAQEEPGYSLSGVAKDSPADKGGLKGGDLIVKLGDSRIGSLEDFDSALRKYKAGDKVEVVVRREGQEVTLTVTLAPPR